MSLSWCYGDTHAAKLTARLHSFRRVREPLDEGPELTHAGIFLIESDQGHALVKMRHGNLVAVRILLQDAVVRLDRGGIATSTIVDLGLVVVGVSRERIVGVVLGHVAKLGGGQGVFRRHVVAECGLVEFVRRRNGWPGGCSGLGGLRDARGGLALLPDWSGRRRVVGSRVDGSR